MSMIALPPHPKPDRTSYPRSLALKMIEENIALETIVRITNLTVTQLEQYSQQLPPSALQNNKHSVTRIQHDRFRTFCALTQDSGNSLIDVSYFNWNETNAPACC